jgi:hypothetical protein
LPASSRNGGPPPDGCAKIIRASENEALVIDIDFTAVNQECADALIINNAAAGALGMFHSAYRLILLALQAASIAGLAILMAAAIKIFARFAHDEPPIGLLFGNSSVWAGIYAYYNS